MSRLPALVALIGTAGCVVGPAYQRPDVQVPETHRFSEAAAQNPEASLADLKWWEIVRDPVLQELVREALAGNPDLKVAATRVTQAAALARATGADLWPQLNAAGNITYGRPQSLEVNPLAKTSDQYSLGLGLSWEIDLWGKVRSAKDASLADLRASEGIRDAARASLVAAVAQAYIELRALDLELEITRASAEARRGSLDLVESRAKGGVGNDLELNQARSDWASAEAAIPSTERDIGLQESRLCILLGRPPSAIARGEGLLGQAVPEQLPTGVPAALLRRRPDVRAAEEAVVVAYARTRVARANRLPSLTLSGTLALDALDPSRLFTADAVAASVGAGVFAPIFDAGRLAALEEFQRAEIDATAEQWRAAVFGALRDVADATWSWKTLGRVRQAQDIQVASAREAERLARLRFEGGVTNFLEVLDAQRVSYSAEIALVQTQRDEIVSVIQLYRALGGGWEDSQPTESQPPPAQPAAAPAGSTQGG